MATVVFCFTLFVRVGVCFLHAPSLTEQIHCLCDMPCSLHLPCPNMNGSLPLSSHLSDLIKPHHTRGQSHQCQAAASPGGIGSRGGEHGKGAQQNLYFGRCPPMAIIQQRSAPRRHGWTGIKIFKWRASLWFTAPTVPWNKLLGVQTFLSEAGWGREQFKTAQLKRQQFFLGIWAWV